MLLAQLLTRKTATKREVLVVNPEMPRDVIARGFSTLIAAAEWCFENGYFLGTKREVAR